MACSHSMNEATYTLEKDNREVSFLPIYEVLKAQVSQSLSVVVFGKSDVVIIVHLVKEVLVMVLFFCFHLLCFGEEILDVELGYESVIEGLVQ